MDIIEYILSNIEKISIVLTLFVAFNTYLFNYEAKAHFGSLEIGVTTNNKILPIINGIVFFEYILGSMLIAHNINKNKYEIDGILNNEIFHYCAIITIIVILCYICFKEENKLKLFLEEKYEGRLNKKSNKIIVIKVLLLQVIIAIALGCLSVNSFQNDINTTYDK